MLHAATLHSRKVPGIQEKKHTVEIGWGPSWVWEEAEAVCRIQIAPQLGDLEQLLHPSHSKTHIPSTQSQD